ncbi:Dolichyl-diphosphooligosaccharide--protein glycosyltransferase subunit [Nymphaea thermarum]|nr:Dolichyl-diphosphooligosaccharide--protein glycosyltransferase subunit [Nymphaea thermarum]
MGKAAWRALTSELSTKQASQRTQKNIFDPCGRFRKFYPSGPEVSTSSSGSPMTPSTRCRGLGGSLDVAAVLDFVDSCHDLILAADVGASDLIRDIATECGADFDEDPSAVVIDHTGYAVPETEGEHTLIAGDYFIQSKIGRRHSQSYFSWFSYSANPNTKLSSPPTLTGSAISLVSVVQFGRISADPTLIQLSWVLTFPSRSGVSMAEVGGRQIK